MAKLFNLARMTTATTGTGTITLGSAVSGYLTFALAGIVDGDVIDYAIKDGANSEIGTGTYTSSGTTLTRAVTKSTNSDAAISLSGAAEVFISPRAETLDIERKRQNFALSAIMMSKLSAAWLRLVSLFALGFKGADDTANGINTGASSNYDVDSSVGKVSPSTDNDSFTKVLLHFDGTNGSTTITDSNAGGSAHTWTANGATISTSQSKFGGASGTFSGSSQWVSTPDSADFTLGSGDFTVDLWFYVSGGNGTRRILAGQMAADGTTASASFWLEMTTGNVINAAANIVGTYQHIVGTTAITSAGWHHAAFVRAGNTLKLFVDGTQEGGDLAISGSVGDSSQTLSVGRMGAFTSNTWNGFIDEFRLSVGVARWTSNFTPPTLAYGSTIQNMTLVTAAQTADASVSNGRVLIEYDNTATPTLNSDITAEVTCNGGTNWTNAPLKTVTEHGPGGLYVAESEEIACTAGTSFAARIKTFNNSKNIPIYGIEVEAMP